MTKYKIEAVPLADSRMDSWRDPFIGIEYKEPETGLVISGGVDDIWETPEKKLIIVDYKSTSKEGSITELTDSPWDKQYTRQLGVYRRLLEKTGFTVEETGYLVYANASKELDAFDDKLIFETTLVSVKTDTSWILPTLHNIKTSLESNNLPVIGDKCEFCPYREACGKKLQAIYHASKK